MAEIFPPEFFKALCDPNRVALLAWLARERAPRSVTEIANAGCCSVDISVVSRHLAVLRDAGLLASEKRGKEVFYRLHAQSVVRRLRDIANALEACCGTPSDP